MLANTVDASIFGYNEFADQIEAGNVRALAIGTRSGWTASTSQPWRTGGGRRADQLARTGRPAGMTAEQRQALIDIVAEMSNGHAWQDTLARNHGGTPFSGDEFNAFLKTEAERSQIADELGIGA